MVVDHELAPPLLCGSARGSEFHVPDKTSLVGAGYKPWLWGERRDWLDGPESPSRGGGGGATAGRAREVVCSLDDEVLTLEALDTPLVL